MAPVLSAVALLLHLQLDHRHGPMLLIMLLPVLAVSYRGGFGPGAFCTALVALASDYFLLEPLRSLSISGGADRVDFLILVTAGLLVSALNESLLRMRRGAETAKIALLERILMLNQTYDGVFIWEWDGAITFWNAAAARLYGFSEREAVGRISHELLRTDTAGGIPSVLKALKKDRLWEGELHHTTRNGSRLTLQSRMLLVKEPGRTFVVETNRDITDAQHTEAELARIQQRFETAFRLSPLGKLVVRLADDRIIEVNESYAKLFGGDPAEIVGRSLREHNLLLDPTVLTAVRESLKEGRAVTGLDVRFQRRNRDIGTGVLYAELLQGAPDPHALLVLHDVTERQLAEDKLRLVNYDLQQFAYAAAHDLQEPTRNISTALGFFHRTYRSTLDQDGIQLIEESIDSAKRMNQMIRDLLNFTHAEAEGSLHTVLVDANEALRRVENHLKLLIEETNAEITAAELPVLQIQPTHLLQLFQNLIGNALKYRSPGVPPRVAISARLEGARWIISVADNGIGFDSEFAEQIFGVFKRLHHTAEYSGNGIGLAICERIVRLYGGKIWAESEPGRGATFLFTLPAAETAPVEPSNAMRTAV